MDGLLPVPFLLSLHSLQNCEITAVSLWDRNTQIAMQRRCSSSIEELLLFPSQQSPTAAPSQQSPPQSPTATQQSPTVYPQSPQQQAALQPLSWARERERDALQPRPPTVAQQSPLQRGQQSPTAAQQSPTDTLLHLAMVSQQPRFNGGSAASHGGAMGAQRPLYDRPLYDSGGAAMGGAMGAAMGSGGAAMGGAMGAAMGGAMGVGMGTMQKLLDSLQGMQYRHSQDRDDLLKQWGSKPLYVSLHKAMLQVALSYPLACS